MKTHQVDLARARREHRERMAAATDAALAALDAINDKAPPRGVVPDLGNASRVPSMSLGTRRLCNDHRTEPPEHAEDSVVLNEYDRPTIACIEWKRVTFYREAGPKRPSDRPPEPKDNDKPDSDQGQGDEAGSAAAIRDGNLTRGVFNGYMSPATRRKVRKIVSTWVRSIMLYRADIKKRWDPGRAYPVFVTVTLPSDQVHSDSVINRACLQPFLQMLKRHHGIENYFWRAESQENGRVHFHILTDRYIGKEDLQVSWNKAVNRLGYVDRYYEASGDACPPSTEIHRVRSQVKDRKTGKMRDVDPVDYLLDYVMDAATLEQLPEGEDQDKSKPRRLVGKWRKPDGTIGTYYTRPITGRVWGMSDALRSIREPRAEASYRLITALEKAKEAGVLRRIDQDHATLYFGPVALVIGRAHRGMWQLIKDYYINVFGYLYPAQLPPEYVRGKPLQNPVNLWLDLEHFASYTREPAVIEAEAPKWDWRTQDRTMEVVIGGSVRVFYTPEWLQRFPDVIIEEPHMIPPGWKHYRD